MHKLGARKYASENHRSHVLPASYTFALTTRKPIAPRRRTPFATRCPGLLQSYKRQPFERFLYGRTKKIMLYQGEALTAAFAKL